MLGLNQLNRSWLLAGSASLFQAVVCNMGVDNVCPPCSRQLFEIAGSAIEPQFARQPRLWGIIKVAS